MKVSYVIALRDRNVFDCINRLRNTYFFQEIYKVYFIEEFMANVIGDRSRKALIDKEKVEKIKFSRKG